MTEDADNWVPISVAQGSQTSVQISRQARSVGGDCTHPSEGFQCAEAGLSGDKGYAPGGERGVDDERSESAK